jgi:hypothetical protein
MKSGGEQRAPRELVGVTENDELSKMWVREGAGYYAIPDSPSRAIDPSVMRKQSVLREGSDAAV